MFVHVSLSHQCFYHSNRYQLTDTVCTFEGKRKIQNCNLPKSLRRRLATSSEKNKDCRF